MKRNLASASRDISPPPNAKRKTTVPKSASSPQSSILTVAMSSFFTPLTQKKSSPTTMDWKIRDNTLLMGKYRAQDIKPKPTKIAAFDLVFP
jgi:hypothetical protein